MKKIFLLSALLLLVASFAQAAIQINLRFSMIDNALDIYAQSTFIFGEDLDNYHHVQELSFDKTGRIVIQVTDCLYHDANHIILLVDVVDKGKVIFSPNFLVELNGKESWISFMSDNFSFSPDKVFLSVQARLID